MLAVRPAKNPVLQQLGEQRRTSSGTLENEKAVIERDLRKLGEEISGMAGLATNKGNGARAAIDRLADLHDHVGSLDGRLAQGRPTRPPATQRDLSAMHKAEGSWMTA